MASWAMEEAEMRTDELGLLGKLVKTDAFDKIQEDIMQAISTYED